MTLRQIAIRMRIVRGELTDRTATPEGGARRATRARVRGCVAAAALALSTPVHAQPLASGQDVTLHEVLIDGATLRFRFVAPAIADVEPEAALADIETLCSATVVDYMAEHGLSAEQVVISLMDRPVPFGTSDPEATQFFEAYRIEDGACRWEEF